MENHSVTIESRERAAITDIKEIDSFDEEEIKLSLNHGALVIRGENLHIHTLDLTVGTAEVSGLITSLLYVKVREKGEKGILARLIK